MFKNDKEIDKIYKKTKSLLTNKRNKKDKLESIIKVSHLWQNLENYGRVQTGLQGLDFQHISPYLLNLLDYGEINAVYQDLKETFKGSKKKSKKKKLQIFQTLIGKNKKFLQLVNILYKDAEPVRRRQRRRRKRDSDKESSESESSSDGDFAPKTDPRKVRPRHSFGQEPLKDYSWMDKYKFDDSKPFKKGGQTYIARRSYPGQNTPKIKWFHPRLGFPFRINEDGTATYILRQTGFDTGMIYHTRRIDDPVLTDLDATPPPPKSKNKYSKREYAFARVLIKKVANEQENIEDRQRHLDFLNKLDFFLDNFYKEQKFVTKKDIETKHFNEIMAKTDAPYRIIKRENKPFDSDVSYNSDESTPPPPILRKKIQVKYIPPGMRYASSNEEERSVTTTVDLNYSDVASGSSLSDSDISGGMIKKESIKNFQFLPPEQTVDDMLGQNNQQSDKDDITTTYLGVLQASSAYKQRQQRRREEEERRKKERQEEEEQKEQDIVGTGNTPSEEISSDSN